jgi:hypothetical protein
MGQNRPRNPHFGPRLTHVARPMREILRVVENWVEAAHSRQSVALAVDSAWLSAEWRACFTSSEELIPS